MGLSQYEHEAFASIIGGLEDRPVPRMHARIAGIAFALVGAALGMAVLLGVPLDLLLAFGATFTIGMIVGVRAIGRPRHRHRRHRRQASPNRH